MKNIYFEQKDILSNSLFDLKNPLGIGQDNDALREVAKDVLPSYLLDEDGSVSSLVTNVFVRLYYHAFPRVEFVEKNGKLSARVNVSYEVTPYLVVGEISCGEFNIQTFEISRDVLEMIRL